MYPYQKFNELGNMHLVHSWHNGISFRFKIRSRYTFIKSIKDICEKGEYHNVLRVIVPILEQLTSDKDNSIRQITLNQFEYIANVFFLSLFRHSCYLHLTTIRQSTLLSL